MANYQDSASNTGPVGTNIFRLRRKLRITQKQLAAPEFSISYISAIERGRIRPSLKALDILARRLGVPSAELLADPSDDTDLGSVGPKDSTASLTTLLSHRRSPTIISLTLAWASVKIAQRDPQAASELLALLNPAAINTEQRLVRLYLLGRIALMENRPADAQAMLEPVLQQGDFSDHRELQEFCRFVLASAYQAQEKFLLADEAFAACIQAIENNIMRDRLFAIEVYAAFAEHHRRRERRDAAVACYQQALNRFDFVLEPARLAEASARLSQQHLENVHSTLADWYAARSRVLFELDEARQHLTQAASNLGLTFRELGDPQTAEQQLRQALGLCERLGTRRQAILTRIALADLLLERQESQEAESLALEAQALCRPAEQDASEDEILYGRVLFTLADACRALGRPDDAERCFKQAIQLLLKHNASEHLAQAYYRYSTLLHHIGRDAESYIMVSKAYLLDKHG